MTISKQPVAIVTGASSGIGKEIALKLVQAGFRVFGTSRKPQHSAALHARVEMLALDVSDAQSVKALVAEVIHQTGRIDLLVNNAGMGIAGGAEESSEQQARMLFDINVLGLMAMTREVLPYMRERSSGRIINISSVLGFIPAPYMAIYASTKHAIEGFSESLDHEVRTLGIRVSLVQPAYTRTSFEQNMAEVDAPLSVYESARANFYGNLKRVMASADDPVVVATTVMKAVNDKAPKLRYTAGKLAGKLALLRRFVPSKAFDSAIRKENQLPMEAA